MTPAIIILIIIIGITIKRKELFKKYFCEVIGATTLHPNVVQILTEFPEKSENENMN